MTDELKAYLDQLRGAGLRMECTFVPYSVAEPQAIGEDGKRWECFNWRVTLTGTGPRPFTFTTDYHTGTAHVTDAGNRRLADCPTSYTRKCELLGMLESGKGAQPPELPDVLYSLVSDSEAIDYSFEDWCGEFGYNSDSRKAEATYRACCETAHNLRKLIGSGAVSRLRELFQDY